MADMREKIEPVLVEVRPRLARHGGGVDLVDVDESEGIIKLRLRGGCAGCAMANLTLKAGIESLIRKAVPEVVQVIDVTDHEAAEDPFYKMEA